MRPAACLVALLAAMAGATGARQLPPPGLQTHIVRGRVAAAADAALVLRGARVSVLGATDAPPAFTDGEGRFAIAAGSSFTLAVTKAGFAPLLFSAERAPAGEVRLRMAPGAALTGVVTDELGFPVHGALVRARWLDAPAAAAAAGLREFTTETGEAGEFRIGSLPPGRYTAHTERAPVDPVAATAGPPQERMTLVVERMRLDVLRREAAQRPPPPMSAAVAIDARAGAETRVTLVHAARAVSPPDAPIAGALSGVVFDEFSEPAEGVAVRLWRLRYVNDRYVAEPTTHSRRTNDRGEYRLFHVPPGRYLVVATLDDLGFAPVYFPGGTSTATASPVVVTRQQETPGINVAFTRVREARVFGFALAADGRSFEGEIVLMPSRRSGAIAVPPRFATVEDDGTFELLNVAPGEYVLRTMPPLYVAHRRIHDGPDELGVQFVTVSGPEVAPVVLRASRTATLSGRVMVEGDRRDVSLSEFVIRALPDPDYGSAAVATAFPAADGTFTLRGLAGPVRLAMLPSPGWWLVSADVGGIDAAVEPVRLSGSPDSRTDVRVVVADGAGTISGRVVDDRGEAPDDFRVIVFAAGRERWYGASPYVRVEGALDSAGGFAVRGLPPADYLVAAVDGIDGDADSGDWQNPAVLDALAVNAARVSLERREEERLTQVRLVRWLR